MQMRSRFEQQLKTLNDSLILLGSECEDCINYATQAIVTGAHEVADKAIEIEKDSDIKQQEIQALCMKILLQQQPVACDLRTISAALKMITDMERIADQGSDIAEITKHVDFSTNSYVKNVACMADSVVRMLNRAVTSFVQRDKSIALEVASLDDEVDDYFRKSKQDIIDMILSGGTNDRKMAEESLEILMVAKYFERIGDHTVNIAEAVISMLDGEAL